MINTTASATSPAPDLISESIPPENPLHEPRITFENNPEPQTSDYAEILRSLPLFMAPDRPVEIRVLGVSNGYKSGVTFSGYFDTAQAVVEQLTELENNADDYHGIYITINAIHPGLLARRTPNQLSACGQGDSTTGDNDIIARRYLMIDVDAKRPPGISSNESEHDYALTRGLQIADDMVDKGWPFPIIADSGNGCHLQYPIDLPAADDGLVERVLKAFANQYTDAGAEIDLKVGNPSRICRLYGTIALKGDHTAERPHRISRILLTPDTRVVVSQELLEAYAASAPLATQAPKRQGIIKNNTQGAMLDVPAWLEKYNLATIGPAPYEGGERWVFKTCPWNADHADKAAFLIQFASGGMSAGCQHNGCKGKGWRDLREQVGDLQPGGAGSPDSVDALGRPEVFLPGENVEYNTTGAQLGGLMAKKEKFYNWGGALSTVVRSNGGIPAIKPLITAELPSIFEELAQLKTYKSIKGESVAVGARCSEQTARILQYSQPLQAAVPPIKLISPCPVLVERGKELIQVCGYDRESGIFTGGERAPEVPLSEAVAALKGLLQDFNFASSSDMSRGLASLITPALVFGGLLPGRAPIDLGEADASQSGKGYRNKITAALYQQAVNVVTQRRGGVGSMEEIFNSLLIKGVNFICFDNVRGKIDSPAFESFMTEDLHPAREPHRATIMIDTRRTIVQMTSNAADITTDLANRCACVRILKRDEKLPFKVYQEGDTLEHVRARQSYYLGCVFSAVAAWHGAGKPQNNEVRHDFRAWAGALDWIVRGIFQSAPLLDGHRGTQLRMANPALSWLRTVAIAVKAVGKLGMTLRTCDLLSIIDEAGLELPGLPEGQAMSFATMPGVLQAMGRKLGLCFKAETSVTLDNVRIMRVVEKGGTQYKDIKNYVFADVVA